MTRKITNRKGIAQKIMALAMEHELISAVSYVAPNTEGATASGAGHQRWGFRVTMPDASERFIVMRGQPQDPATPRMMADIARQCGWSMNGLLGIAVPKAAAPAERVATPEPVAFMPS